MVWRKLTRRQIYIEWRECLRWDAEERRRDFDRRADLYHTAGRVFKEVKTPDWKSIEPDWAALYPERQLATAAQGPRKNQWELYQELVRSGRLAYIKRTRHSRPGVAFEEAKKWLKSPS